MRILRTALTLLVSCQCLPVAWAAEVHVAVASNFTAPVKQIAQSFERETGHRLVMSFGSTGQLLAQIKHGAPFEVLLAADSVTPALLERDGLAVAGTRFTYATGKLVLWSPSPGLVDDQGAILRTQSFTKIAMANPKLAPYGAAALETLDKLGLKEKLGHRIIEGANITQAHQFVASGNVPLGFVALSQVFENGRLVSGSAWLVPSDLHAPIRQDAVLLKKGANHQAAQRFLMHLKSGPSQNLIRSFGYSIE